MFFLVASFEMVTFFLDKKSYLHSTSSAGGKWLGAVTHPQLGQLGLTFGRAWHFPVLNGELPKGRRICRITW